MKVGDTVYAACVGFDGEIEVAEAKVTRAGPERVTLDRPEKAWGFRQQVRRHACHMSHACALVALLEETRQTEQCHRDAMEAAQARATTIEAMLNEGKP